MYICLEGMDGSGKSTVARCMVDQLGEDKTLLVRFPSEENFGGVIRGALEGRRDPHRQSLIFAYAADGVDISMRIIEPALREGKVVIADRHPLISGLVYQVGDHHRNFINELRSMAYIAGTRDPSFLVYLDVPAEVALARMESRSGTRHVIYEPRNLAEIERAKALYWKAYEQTKGIWVENTGTAEDMAAQLIERFRLRERVAG